MTLTCAVFVVHGSCFGGPPASFRAELLRLATSVNAWQIEFETIAASSTNVVALRRLVAVQSPASLYFWGSKRTIDHSMTFSDYPLQRRLIFAEGTEYWDLPRRRSFYFAEGGSDNLFRGSLAREAVWAAMLWWPLARKMTQQFGSEPYIVIDVLESDDYRFRDSIEEVNGRMCHVLECPGCSALWFDADRVGAIVARELYLEGTNVPRCRIELAGHREINPGVWCPMEFRNLVFDVNAPKVAGEMPRITDERFQVVDIRLDDDVDKRLFKIPKPQPGAIELLKDGSYRQVASGGYDYIEEVVKWVNRYKRRGTPSRVSAVRLGCQAAISVVAVCLTVAMWMPARRLRDSVAANNPH